MEIKQRIVFRNDEHQELIDYLDYNKIEYEDDQQTSFIVLEILESSKHWPAIKDYLIRNDTVFIAEPIYSKEETEQAEWLTVRSQWRWQYPQPEADNRYLHITYSQQNACSECGSNKTQIGSFRLKKPPKWNKRNFLILNAIDDELFLSDKARNILSNSSLSGFEFYDVFKSDGCTKLEDISQLKVNHLLSAGLVDQENTIKETNKCKKCGVDKYVIMGRGLVYKSSVFRNDIDIANSFEVFGFGRIAGRCIFVNQMFYQVIKQNCLDRNLVFEPVKLV